MVFVSHRLDEVVEIAERVTVLRDGRKVGTFPAAEVDDRRIGELMTGAEHRAADHRARRSAAGRRCSRCGGLTPRRRIRRTSPSPCTRGEVAGPDRAARRRPHRARAGAVRHDPARCRRDPARRRRPILLASNQDAIAAGIAYVSEDRLNRSASTCASRSPTISSSPSLDRLAQSPRAGSRRSGGASLAADWVDRLQHQDARASTIRCSTLSGGNQQRVVLAQVAGDRPEGADPRLARRSASTSATSAASTSWSARSPASGVGDPADLRRGAGGLLQLRPRAAHARRAGSSASSFPAPSSEHALEEARLCVALASADSGAPRRLLLLVILLARRDPVAAPRPTS